MALTQVASGLIASVAASTLTGTQTIPRGTLPTGSVLQVVSANSTTTASTTGGTFIDTGLSATITPTSATSKIFILVTECFYVSGGGADAGGAAQIVRNSTAIFASANTNAIYINATGVTAGTSSLAYIAMNYLDSPATTSATTYKTQFKAEVGATIVAQGNNNESSITLMEISA